jgi:cyanophycinase
MISNVADAAERACPQLVDVRLHLLPAGTRFEAGGEGANVPAPLEDVFRNLIRRNPIS